LTAVTRLSPGASFPRVSDRDDLARGLRAALSGRLAGAVLGPDDGGYPAAIAAFNSAVVHRVPLVVAAVSQVDVLETVRAARAAGCAVSVQATGHGASAPLTVGVLVTTGGLDRVEVDPVARSARIGAGVRWGAVIAAAAPHGLAPITGSSPGVGAVGYLLGGGLGPLARSHGFSSDYLTALTVVTGEGEVVEASAENHPDLFWALRGGKAGLGIVTEAQLRLVELPQLYAGSLLFEDRHLEVVLRAWVDFTTRAPDDVTTSLAVIDFPPLEVIPPPLRGRRLLSLRFAYPGTAERGARLAAPLRAAAPVYIDGLGDMALADVARIHSDPTDPGPTWNQGLLLSHIDQAWASAVIDHIGPGRRAPFLVVEFRHIGGATHTDVAEGSAVGGRGADYTLTMISRDVTGFATVLPAAAQRLVAALAPWVTPETNINFTHEPRTDGPRITPWSPATAARLQEIRRRYDPDGLFTQPGS
jgi:FAD/FMN-containing dehydrogenase